MSAYNDDQPDQSSWTITYNGLPLKQEKTPPKSILRKAFRPILEGLNEAFTPLKPDFEVLEKGLLSPIRKYVAAPLWWATRKTTALLVAPMKYAATIAGISAAVAVGGYMVDEKQDIMDIPDDMAAFFERHPEIGETVDRYTLEPIREYVKERPSRIDCTNEKNGIKGVFDCTETQIHKHNEQPSALPLVLEP